MFDPYVAGKFRSRLTLPLGTHAIKDNAKAIVRVNAICFISVLAIDHKELLGCFGFRISSTKTFTLYYGIL